MRLEEKRPQADCKPLIAAATAALYRRNVFRITGLAVDATPREVTKHADKLALMAELGHGKQAAPAAYCLKPPPGVDEIREAIQKLKEPEIRIIEEFFWFWPDQFGESQSDAAIQALAKGDSKTALQIWSTKEDHPVDGVIALHNLALAYHLTALDWETYAVENQIESEQQQQIVGYWRGAFKRWELLVVDDRLWERVNARIRQMDDARLTTGFARRMRSSLPEALGTINAELALKYAEKGKLDLARVHVQYMHETNKGLVNLEKTADTVLGAAKTRIREQLQRAQHRTESAPADGANAVKELLEHTDRSVTLFDLFYGRDSGQRIDLNDEIASVCNQLLITYQKATDDDHTCLGLLKTVLPITTSITLREQIAKNISTLDGNIGFKKLQPVYEAMRIIEEGKKEPRGKLSQIREDILPILAGIIRTEGRLSNVARLLSDRIATTLRSISIDANNEHGDTQTSIEAISSAIELAHEPELKTRLAADKMQIEAIKQDQEKNNLLLEIKNDSIEINKEKVRYNSTTFLSTDIDGIRFGSFVQYTNGVKSSVSYLIAVNSVNHGVIEIECKRWFRSEDLAQSDFNSIVNSLYHQIIPAVVRRIAKNIVSGKDVALGECALTAKGIRLSTGILFWRAEHLLAWSDVRFGFHQGSLTINSAQNPKVATSLSVRAVWNAVIFKELANAVVTLLAEQKQN